MENVADRLALRQLIAQLVPDFAGRLPRNYFVFDCETTGVLTESDLITQLGWCVVEDCQPTYTDAVVLDWASSGLVDPAWLYGRMEQTRKQMEYTPEGTPTGVRQHVTYDVMKRHGIDPRVCIQNFFELVAAQAAAGDWLVAHNGFKFDVAMIESNAKRVAVDYSKLRDYNLFDTGLVEKACQVHEAVWPSESRTEFLDRIARSRNKGVKWSLWSHCVPKYSLLTGLDLDPRQSHAADVDAVVTHRLLEKYREIAEAGAAVPA